MAHDPDPQPPFRWNIASRPELGGLIDVPEEASDWLLGHLRQALARVLGFCDNADLIFLGRSPEQIYDFGCGLLAASAWRGRLHHLQMSLNTNEAHHSLSHESPGRQFMRRHLAEAGLSPRALLARPAPIALVDVVDSGDTFGSLVKLLRDWALEEREDWPAASSKLRLVGLVSRKKTSPKTWRWQQHADWLGLLPSGACKNVALDTHFWAVIASSPHKTTPAYRPADWGGEEAARPNRDSDHLQGLALARWLYEQGASREQRLLLAEALAAQPAMRHGWYRRLARELRLAGGRSMA